MWSDDKFRRSSDELSTQHYIANAVIPTRIADLNQMLSADDKFHFRDLPVRGSRAVLAGFYSVMDDALRAIEANVHRHGSIKKVHALMAAALSFPIRMRMNPSSAQIGLDSITYTEDLVAGGACNSPSFFGLELYLKTEETDGRPLAVWIRKQSLTNATGWE